MLTKDDRFHMFTEKEKEYIKSQRLARIATVSSVSTSDIVSK